MIIVWSGPPPRRRELLPLAEGVREFPGGERLGRGRGRGRGGPEGLEDGWVIARFK